MNFNHIIKSFFIISLLNFVAIYHCNENKLLPTVFIAILVRNKEHTLPYFFGALERLDYPKDRMAIWIWSYYLLFPNCTLSPLDTVSNLKDNIRGSCGRIYSDNNIDHSPELLQKWAANQTSYHSLEVHIEPGHLQDSGIFDWSTERFSHLINLREKALLEARQRWADYIWV
ncbi:CERCAM [Cordylochernes scorpioides]|uniref:CERCAM n=1 Tax=Cordylochernes scorpioides TaxID=51811 RepID=A0ABY6KCY0_9ARAC|nr:CERCAM [Cordylochernes scorpioides]